MKVFIQIVLTKCAESNFKEEIYFLDSTGHETKLLVLSLPLTTIATEGSRLVLTLIEKKILFGPDQPASVHKINRKSVHALDS